MGLIQDAKDYQPTMTAMVWTAVGASALTMAVGFFGLGWVTGGTAEEMAEDARSSGHAELAAAICAENFRTTPAALEQYNEISDMSGFRQRQFIEDQPWALMPGAESVGRETAQLCATKITEMDPDALPSQSADDTSEAPTSEPG